MLSYSISVLFGKFGTSKMHLAPGSLACCPFKGDGSDVVDSLFIVAPIVRGGSVFGPCFVIQYFMSLFCNHLERKRELVALLNLSSWCFVTVSVLWLFHTVPLVGLQCVIVVFPDHTHLRFRYASIFNYTMVGQASKSMTPLPVGKCLVVVFSALSSFVAILKRKRTLTLIAYLL